MLSKNTEITTLLEEVLNDRGVPRNIKNTISESMTILGKAATNEEKIASIISVLDEVSNDPNLSMHSRTHIWNIVSVLEGLQKQQV